MGEKREGENKRLLFGVVMKEKSRVKGGGGRREQTVLFRSGHEQGKVNC